MSVSTDKRPWRRQSSIPVRRTITWHLPTFRFGPGLNESMLVFVDKVTCLREFREI